MITKKNFTPELMSRITKFLPRHTKEIISKKTGCSYTLICNTWTGKTYNEIIIKEIINSLNEVKKEVVQLASRKALKKA